MDNKAAINGRRVVEEATISFSVDQTVTFRNAGTYRPLGSKASDLALARGGSLKATR